MTTTDMVVATLLLVAAFCVGIVVGTYINRMPLGGGKHRLGSKNRGAKPSTSSQDQPGPLLTWNQERGFSPEDAKKFDQALQEWKSQPLRPLQERFDTYPTAERTDNGHWEGLSGTLELQQPTLDIHPLPAAGSALGSIHSSVRPVFGKTEHVMYDPDEYEGALACNNCRTPLIKGQMFWSISLPEEGEGVILPICDPCEANSHG
jgi:hypothetical protein